MKLRPLHSLSYAPRPPLATVQSLERDASLAPGRLSLSLSLSLSLAGLRPAAAALAH